MAQGSRVTACGVWIQHTEAQQGTAIDLVAIRSPCGTSLAQICRVYTMLYNALEVFTDLAPASTRTATQMLSGRPPSSASFTLISVRIV